MKIEAYEIEVTSRIILSKRELQLLNHLTSYDNSQIASFVVTGHYAGGVTKEEMVQFLQRLNQYTSEMMTKIEANKTTIFKGNNCGV